MINPLELVPQHGAFARTDCASETLMRILKPTLCRLDEVQKSSAVFATARARRALLDHGVVGYPISNVIGLRDYGVILSLE